ncbi:MAG: hypothetical protein PHE32_01240 [Candidatus Shapirobacteria bacterium]|nr:hypothetical protein [Candidatus Shapirobacteria bacterium]
MIKAPSADTIKPKKNPSKPKEHPTSEYNPQHNRHIEKPNKHNPIKIRP